METRRNSVKAVKNRSWVNYQLEAKKLKALTNQVKILLSADLTPRKSKSLINRVRKI